MKLDEAAPPPDDTQGWHRDPLGNDVQRYWSGSAWTDQVRAHSETPPRIAKTDVQPVGLGIAVLGAMAMAIAVFLPQLSDPASIVPIRDNTLIQNGGGWAFLAYAVFILIAAYRTYTAERSTWWIIGLGLFAVFQAYHLGTDEESRRLVSAAGKSLNVAEPGVGIYMAGIGGAAAMIGGWLARTGEAPDDKTPPDREAERG